MPSKKAALPAFIQIHREGAQAIRQELALGLGKAQAQIAPKFLYDALGVTAAFDRNLLLNLNLNLNLNRWLGADFRPEQWAHRAFFDSVASRIEMHLEALSPITVRWVGGGWAVTPVCGRRAYPHRKLVEMDA